MKKKLLNNSFFLYKCYLYYYLIKSKYRTKKKTYSQFGEDLIVNKFFKNFVGKYVDIGCYHPIKYNNTLLLYEKGWTGINIDLNQTSIDLFNVVRKNDLNILACLSDKEEEVVVYFDNKFSALNSIYTKNLDKFGIKDFKKIKVKTKIFSNLVKDNFDFLNIDCEGNDYKILRSIDLKKYNPKLICIEISSKEDKKSILEYLNTYTYELIEVKDLSYIFKKK
tara:strand:- start:89 stop:754 length:666 start_codon:yes stop_codon:yes gene_type:complete